MFFEIGDGLLVEALTLALLFSAAILVVALLVGLVVSVLQAATQIQEQTLTFVPKIVCAYMLIFFFGSWGFAQLRIFFGRVFDVIVSV